MVSAKKDHSVHLLGDKSDLFILESGITQGSYFEQQRFFLIFNLDLFAYLFPSKVICYVDITSLLSEATSGKDLFLNMDAVKIDAWFTQNNLKL